MELQPSNNLNSFDDSFSYRERHKHRHDVLERLIYAAGSFLVTLLLARFVLALLGANPANSFASFVYSFTAPFAAPFYSLFSYDHPSMGVSVFEVYTLIAAAAYAIATSALARLASLTRYS